MLERVIPAHQRPFPVRQAQPVAVLQPERLFLVGEAELRGRGEMTHHVGGGRAGADLGDRVVHELTGPPVRGTLLPVRAADVECPVIAGPVPVERVDNVEISGVPGPDQPVGENMGMRAAPLTGNGIYRLHLFRAVLVQVPGHQRDAGVLPDARPQVPVQLVVGAVHEGGGMVQQRDLIGGLDGPDILHETVPVDDMQALRLQRAQHRKFHHIHPDRLGVQAVIAQDTGQPAGVAALDPHLLRDGAAPARNSGPPVLPVIPRREHLVRPGRRPDIPQDRLLPAHHQAAPEQLVPGPVPNVGSGGIPDIVHIEQNQRSYFRTSQRVADFSRAVGPQPGKINPLLPVRPQRCSGGSDRDGPRRGIVILNHVGSFKGYTGAYSPASAGRAGTRGGGPG